MDPNKELTEEEIQAQLAGNAVAGPLKFRERLLAPLSRGLRDLRNKLVAPDDTAVFHDAMVIHLLTEAYGESELERLDKRRGLMMAADDVAGIRATVSVLIDTFSPEEEMEIKAICNKIFGVIEKAKVEVIAKKKSGEKRARPSPTTTRSRSSSSRKKPAGAPTS